MINTKQIKEYAKKNNLRFEENFTCSYTYSWDSFTHGLSNDICAKHHDYSICLEMKSGVWFWWTALGSDGVGYDSELFFSQRYNQNNGSCIKGFRTGFNAEGKIKDSLKQ